MSRLEFLSPELLSMLAVDHPPSTRLDMLTRRDGDRAADDGDQLVASPDLDPQHGKAVLRVMVRNSFDESVQDLGHTTVPNRVTSPALSGRTSPPPKHESHCA